MNGVDFWGEAASYKSTPKHPVGKIEHDVEHYRPKSRVSDWFSEAVNKDLADWPKTFTRSGAAKTAVHPAAA